MANTDPLEWRLLDTDFSTVLGIFPSDGGNLYIELNEPGSGSFSIPLDSEIASVVTVGMFAQCNYRGASRGGFLIDNLREVDADSQEGAGRKLSLSGRGALAILDEAIISDDGTGNTSREFTGTKAGIMIDLIDEAIARGAITNVEYDFTASVDSESASWTDSESLSLPVGTTILEVLRQFAETGIDFNMVVETDGVFTLQAFVTEKGSDLSETVYFRVGTNCEEVLEDKLGTKVNNVLKLKWRDAFANVSDSTSITAYRRREKILNIEAAQSAASAVTYGAAKLSNTKDPQRSLPIKVYDDVSPYAFVSYNVGDYITIDRFGVEASERVRGMQLSFMETGYARITITLNDTILENDIRMSRDLNWLMKQWNTARDSKKLEVRFWAAIGDPNITYDVVEMLFVGDLLYATNSNDLSLLIYDTDGGGWTRILFPEQPLRLANVGGAIYVSAIGGGVYKYESGTITLIADFSYSVNPSGVGVTEIITIGTDLYFSGSFDEVDSVSIDGVAKYDTIAETWSDLGGGSIAGVMATDGTNIYAAFSGAVKKYSGSWSSLGDAFPIVYALKTYDDTVLVGTNSASDGIQKWNGASWDVFEGGVDGNVLAIEAYLTDVYIGGTFTDVGSRVARFSGGAWWQLEEGTNNSIFKMALKDQDLYVSGSFTTAGDKSAQGIAAYFMNFESMANYLENSTSGFNLGEAIHNATAKTPMVAADEMPLWDSITQQLRKITWANILVSIKSWADDVYVALTGDQTVAGVKTFSSFPLTPSSAPTTDYQVANKKYVDDNAGSGTPAGSDREVQFNDSGAFGADEEFIYQSDVKSLGLGVYDDMPYDTTRMMWLVGDDESPSHFGVAYGSARAAFAGFAKADGSAASPANVKDDQVIGRVRGYGYDGTEWSGVQAEIRIVADGDWGTDDKPTRIEIWTTPDGSGTLTLAMTIGSDGNVNIASGKEYQVNGVPVGGASFSWATVTADGTLTVNTGHYADKATLLTVALPATASKNDIIRIVGVSAGLFKITQAASQVIYFGNQTTTTGTGGYIQSIHDRDAIELICVADDLEWQVISSAGNFEVA